MFPLSKYAPLTSPLGLGNPLNVLAQIGTVPFVRYFTDIFGQLEFELVPLEFELVTLVLVDAFSEKSDETPVEQAPTAKTVKVMMLVATLLIMHLV